MLARRREPALRTEAWRLLYAGSREKQVLGVELHLLLGEEGEGGRLRAILEQALLPDEERVMEWINFDSADRARLLEAVDRGAPVHRELRSLIQRAEIEDPRNYEDDVVEDYSGRDE